MNDTVSRSKLLTRREAAELLGVKPQTLATWHVTGRYNLPVVKVGRAARYRLADLEKWIAARTVGAVAEVGAASTITGGTDPEAVRRNRLAQIPPPGSARSSFVPGLARAERPPFAPSVWNAWGTNQRK